MRNHATNIHFHPDRVYMSVTWTRVLAFFAVIVAAAAHPMGNFSISHYTLIRPGAKAVDVTYVLDLAELPASVLLQDWKLDAASPRTELDAKAAAQAREWMRNLAFTIDGIALTPRFERAELALNDGAAGLKVMRITSYLRLPLRGGQLEFEDRNFEGRAGWKEIVIRAADGAAIEKASHGDQDRSRMLTVYPSDPTVAPPQDLRASVLWSATPATVPLAVQKTGPVIAPIPQPKAPVTDGRPAPPAAAANPAANQGAPANPAAWSGFISELLSRKELSLWMMLTGLFVAFIWGASHALTPGHGKTIVAAYLVGSRGTLKHAALLGGMVTFTHTISVFLLGLATLFLSKYVVPEKLYPVLGVISGLSIVAVGGMMFFRRLQALRAGQRHHTHHDHDHHHTHDHDHVHAHAAAAPHSHAHHDHDHGHDHHHHDHDHDHHHDHHHDHDHDHHHHHGPGGHSHVIEGDVSIGSLIALGASGGLIPCPSALLLLLGAISLGRVGFGLTLLVSFSLGLAVVLMGIGVLVLYAKHLLPDSRKTAAHPAFRLIPVLSAAVVMGLGLLMTAVSLGWVRPGLVG